ncbi:MAG TPA: hypothetical protein VKQ32_18235 [Polyangia bacterium]|nr:hypothetical protein [Polyangia bacterium]
MGGASAVRAAEKSDEDSTPVSVLIGDAVAEYDAGHFQEARALFRQAHEKSPTARTLRGIGMCSFELRDYVEAARALAASLRDQRRPLTAEQKRHAEALLARAHTFIGRFTVHVKPATASLFVDGHPAELEPDGVLLLPFGRHQLSLRCPSCSPAEKDEDVEVSGGEHKELELALAPSPPVTPPTASGDGAGAGAGASGGAGSQPGGGERDTSADRGHAHLWFMGAAVAAALGAGGSALWWRDQQHQLDLCQDAGPRCSSGQSTVQDRRNIAIGTTIGLGAAAVAGGIVAALLWPHAAEQPTPAAALACVPGDKTVTCAFRF